VCEHLQRGIVGTLHKVSGRYRPRYIAEFQLRYNTRSNPDITAISGCYAPVQQKYCGTHNDANSPCQTARGDGGGRYETSLGNEDAIKMLEAWEASRC
jgi:hypothetical protein